MKKLSDKFNVKVNYDYMYNNEKRNLNNKFRDG